MTDYPPGPIGAARRAADEREQRQAAVPAAEQRAEQAEATLARVRAECDRIEAAVRANATDPDLAGGYLACLRHVRAALDPAEDPAT